MTFVVRKTPVGRVCGRARAAGHALAPGQLAFAGRWRDRPDYPRSGPHGPSWLGSRRRHPVRKEASALVRHLRSPLHPPTPRLYPHTAARPPSNATRLGTLKNYTQTPKGTLALRPPRQSGLERKPPARAPSACSRQAFLLNLFGTRRERRFGQPCLAFVVLFILPELGRRTRPLLRG